MSDAPRGAANDARAADENFRQLIEASPCGMLVVDARGSIRLVNRELERIYGYTREELIGQPIEVLVPHAGRAAHVGHRDEFHQQALGRPMGHQRVVQGVRKDGTIVLAEVGLNSLVMPEGPVTVATVVDVSEREAMLVRLQEQAEDLRRSNEALSQFAAVAAHDLQEPLRMVASFAELLDERCRPQLDDKGLRYLGFIGEGARRMQQLVRDLLAYARVDAEARELRSLDLGTAVQAALDNLAAVIAATDAVVTVGVMPMVLGDQTQLVQLFQNLIANALKFRRDVPPRVTISVEDAGERWRVEVADNGIGMDMKFHERVFEMFQRLHARGQFEGSGLGLAIVRRVVLRHGGTVWFESSPGLGTRFFFTLQKR